MFIITLNKLILIAAIIKIIKLTCSIIKQDILESLLLSLKLYQQNF